MTEHDQQPAVQKSSVKFWRNARGGPQWEVKAVDGATADSIDDLVALALRADRALATGAQAAAFEGEEPRAA